MVSFLKSLQSVLQNVLGELPEGLKVVTEFLYRMRWFIAGGFVLYGLYHMMMVVLPILMWSFLIKTVLGAVFSLLIS